MSKKEEIEMMEHKFKVFKVHKWTILKDIKLQLLQFFQDLYRQRLKVKRILAFRMLHVILKILAGVFRM